MRARTVVFTFGLISVVSVLALFGELVAGRLFQITSPKIHQILPVSSIPHLYRLVFHGDEMKTSSEEQKSEREQKWMTLKLRGGQEVAGELVSEEPGWVTLRIDGSQVGFRSAEILESRRGRPQE